MARAQSLSLLALLALGCKSEPLDEPPAGGAGGPPVSGETRLLTVFERVRVSSDDAAEYVRKATREVDFGEDSVVRAVLQIELESPCYPFESWADEEIPEGHNWPLSCDAFDRALKVSLEGSPGVELVRAVTPFGGPLLMESDVTDVVNGLPGAHELTIEIDTWGDPEGQVSGAKGQWIVSISLELELGPAPRRVLAVQPLTFGSQTEQSSGPLPFTAPEGASLGRIEYRATGHGAAFDRFCRGPAEEFCERSHTLAIDGQPVDEFVAWRDDCATLCTVARFSSGSTSFDYCEENPCGAMESVRAPRANWCPGSMTPPRVVESAELAAPGEHTFESSISELTEGGNWIVSATYFAFE